MRSVELTARGPFPSPRGSAPPSPREFFSPSSGAQLQQLQHQQRQQARADASVAGVVSSSDVPVPEKIRSVVARKAQAQPQPPAFPAPSWERISLPAATSEGQPSPVSLNRARLAELQRPQLRPQDSAQSTRLWRQVVAYQPVDTVVKTVEVPVRRRREVLVSKPVVREKIVHVPKIIPKYVEKVVEVPQVEWVEKVVSVPHWVYRPKLVPKVVLKENIIEKPVYVDKWVEKFVEVPYVEEVVRYRTVHVAEEVIKHIPEGHDEAQWKGAPVFTVPPGTTPNLPDKWVRPQDEQLPQTALQDLGISHQGGGK